MANQRWTGGHAQRRFVNAGGLLFRNHPWIPSPCLWLLAIRTTDHVWCSAQRRLLVEHVALSHSLLHSTPLIGSSLSRALTASFFSSSLAACFILWPPLHVLTRSSSLATLVRSSLPLTHSFPAVFTSPAENTAALVLSSLIYTPLLFHLIIRRLSLCSA
ncbi:hypothetical protein BJX76DRAFT_325896 [Aspergillus varians]